MTTNIDLGSVGPFSLVMLSSDRRKQGYKNYLDTTLKNLQRSGVFESDLFDSLLLCDNNANDPFDMSWSAKIANNYTSHLNIMYGKSCSCNLMISKAFARSFNTEWILFLEDDIDVCDMFLESTKMWLEGANRKYLFYPLGAAYDHVTHRYEQGIYYWQYPVSFFYGTQAFVIKNEWAKRMSFYFRENEFKLNPGGTAWDILMQHWARSCGESNLLTPCPSFVQHIGMNSLLNPRNDIHTFKSWQGQNWSFVEEIGEMMLDGKGRTRLSE